MAPFFSGIAASLVVAILIYVAKGIYGRRKIRAISGKWLEIVQNEKSLRYSVGNIFSRKGIDGYSYNGAGFRKNGHHFCRWTSVNFNYDPSSSKLYYIYTAYDTDNTFVEKTGFGLVRFQGDGVGAYQRAEGFFIDAYDTAEPSAHGMIRLEKAAEVAGLKQVPSDIEGYAELVRKYHDAITGSP